MKLQDIPTPELRRILKATEQVVGPDGMEARIFHRELIRREQAKRRKQQKTILKGGSCD